jgi:hypothetical protein
MCYSSTAFTELERQLCRRHCDPQQSERRLRRSHGVASSEPPYSSYRLREARRALEKILIKSEKFANTTAAMIPLALSEAVDLLMISARDSQWVRCCSRGTEE